jgi:hypothetical protein
MAAPEARSPGTVSPVAVVWCRQVDNEAESPGYTTIPEAFAGRRETLDTIRLVGNFTINVADTHDYWDPEPGQTLSYYPNLFLYPAAGGKHTCVGRMFLSTEDRPRLGMKTLVFDTAQLVATGEFGAAVLRAHASMGGRSDAKRPAAEPEPAVYAAVGEGFLFHRGTTEPVVVVASDQWEAAGRVLEELVRLLPTSLVALGAFLSFPYFLPEAKVNMHEFTEQLPLALAMMRVPRAEAQGDRHAKRISSWESGPVAVRDLTRPPTGRSKETAPLVLQYVRDHGEEKVAEIARRVDLVELSRSRAALDDPERQGGRDRRKEMWRIGTAMETAALLLSRPKGRAVAVSGEATKRANEYLQARPATSAPAEPLMADGPVGATASVAAQLPPWLQRPTEVTLPPPGPVAVPVSVSDDPSLQKLPPPPPPPTPGAEVAPPVVATAAAPPAAPTEPELEAWLKRQVDERFRELARTAPVTAAGPAIDQRLADLSRDMESRWTRALETRIREVAEVEARAILSLQSDLRSRLAAVDARPVFDPGALGTDVEQRVRTAVEARAATLQETVKESSKANQERWAGELRLELRRSVDELAARSAKAEEELRAALVAQLELEVRESKEQSTTVREELEGRVRDILNERLADLEQRRAKDLRDQDQRVGLLLDGRTKDLESKLAVGSQTERDKSQLAFEERVQGAERRLQVELEARVAEIAESQSQTLAGFQVRVQSFFEQKLRENQDREREKYVELLARFKGEVDTALARTIDSTKFDAAVRERVNRLLEATRADDQKSIASHVADAELKLRSTAEEATLRLERVETKLQASAADLARVERTLRHDAEELDRRVQVLTDRMLPLVRRTWLKVSEIEKAGGAGPEADARANEMRREMTREIRRLEGELLEQTTELRDRLESTITAQGRIWLNFVRQLAEAGSTLLPGSVGPESRPTRRMPPRPLADDPGPPPGLPEELRAAAGVGAFEGDPPNPMVPEPVDDPPATHEARRRARRA